ncbi:MAG: SUMF1/EgtB/PvdO family nonheme iron enzyme [Chloroflexi bacterium]|nr:SUMF1/EgtB/PvdO family nonheme iron enzyme [Chloroflexota bacterium]
MNGSQESLYDIFISYAQADRAWVEGYLIDALESAGARVLSEETFRLGAPRILEFERALQQSHRVLLVLSPAYFAADFQRFFDILAQSYGAETGAWPVIPLILHPVDLPPRLAQLVALDASEPERWEEVVAALLRDLKRPRPAAPKIPPCPYPGMAPFTEADSKHFFGREREIEESVQRLRVHPFLAIIGPSGCGKSSLVFAGLLPALRQSSLFGKGEWLVRTLRPGETPHSALQALLADIPSPGERGPFLLVVDQFEETFTLAGDERTAFQNALLALIGQPNAYLTITVRADFYPDLMTSPLWREIQAHRLEVPPLGEEGLREAIVRPAESVGVYVESALVERLVADAAGEPGILPFVQETLVLLWDKLERRFLPLRAYEALVMPRKAYGQPPLIGLQAAMARRAEAAFSTLTTEQQRIARRMFLRLIQFGEGRSHTRRRQPVAALLAAEDDPLQVEATLAHLTQARLITLSGEREGRMRMADLAHEALIEGWPRLAAWVQAHKMAEMERRRLRALAQRWLDLHRRGGLLDETELILAQRWLTSQAAKDVGVDAAILEFVRASEAELKRRKRMRWLRPLAAVMAVMLLAASGFLAYRGFLKAQTLRASPMVQFDAGEAIIGTDDPLAEAWERPQRSVRLEGFALEKYEVSNRLYRNCVRAGACDEPKSDLERYQNAQYALHPVVGVTPRQAQQYCQWLGRRLPTSVEWERAARGANGRAWPWGDEAPRPNQVRMPVPIDAPPLPGPIAVTSGEQSGVSREGLHHLAGNVWEFVVLVDENCQGLECHQPKASNWRPAIMGGSYESSIMRITTFYTIGIESSSPEYGFRCAQLE